MWHRSDKDWKHIRWCWFDRELRNNQQHKCKRRNSGYQYRLRHLGKGWKRIRLDWFDRATLTYQQDKYRKISNIFRWHKFRHFGKGSKRIHRYNPDLQSPESQQRQWRPRDHYHLKSKEKRSTTSNKGEEEGGKIEKKFCKQTRRKLSIPARMTIDSAERTRPGMNHRGTFNSKEVVELLREKERRQEGWKKS
jgi:hypothetical protein